MTDNALLNRPSQAIVEHLKTTRKLCLKVSDITTITGVKDRMVDTTLSDAIELGVLVRRRIGTDIVYMLPDPQASQADAAPSDRTVAVAPAPAPAAPSAATVPNLTPLAQRIEQQAAPVAAAIAKLSPAPAAAAARKQRGGRMQELPLIDVSTLTIRLAPAFDPRQSAARKWDSLFDKLAAEPIQHKGGEPLLPTVEFGIEYHGTLQQAAVDWKKRRKTPAAIKVARSTSDNKTVVQRVA